MTFIYNILFKILNNNKKRLMDKFDLDKYFSIN